MKGGEEETQQEQEEGRQMQNETNETNESSESSESEEQQKEKVEGEEIEEEPEEDNEPEIGGEEEEMDHERWTQIDMSTKTTEQWNRRGYERSKWLKKDREKEKENGQDGKRKDKELGGVTRRAQKVTPNLENAKRFIRKETIKCMNRFEVLKCIEEEEEEEL